MQMRPTETREARERENVVKWGSGAGNETRRYTVQTENEVTNVTLQGERMSMSTVR